MLAALRIIGFAAQGRAGLFGRHKPAAGFMGGKLFQGGMRLSGQELCQLAGMIDQNIRNGRRGVGFCRTDATWGKSLELAQKERPRLCTGA